MLFTVILLYLFLCLQVSHSQTDMDEAQEFHAEPAQHSDSETMENEQPSVAAQHSDLGQTAFSVILHDYLGPVATSSICKATHVTVACPTKTNMTHTAVQTDTMVFTGMPLTGSGKSQASQTDENENPFTTLRYEHIFVNDETVRLYTGVQDVTTLQILFDEIPNIDDSNGKNCGRKSSQRLMDQFVNFDTDAYQTRFGIRRSVFSVFCVKSHMFQNYQQMD